MTNWLPVCHVSEVARNGDFVQVPHNGHVAVSNFGGEIIAWDGRCPHRGAMIYGDARAGNREPRCAYHARLATAANVKRFTTSIWGGFIFVGQPLWQQNRADSLAHLMDGPLSTFIAGVPALTLHSTLSFVMGCDWTVAVENALDFEHVEHAHSQSLAKLALVPKTLDTYANGSSIEEFTSESGRLGHLSKFFPHEQRFDYKHAHLFPHACLSSTRGWM